MGTSEIAPQRTIVGIDGLRALVGEEIGVTAWREIDQELIDRFADATGDHQWIHVDVERCQRESPFGTTIAHGHLILSLIAHSTSSCSPWRVSAGSQLRPQQGSLLLTRPPRLALADALRRPRRRGRRQRASSDIRDHPRARAPREARLHRRAARPLLEATVTNNATRKPTPVT